MSSVGDEAGGYRIGWGSDLHRLTDGDGIRLGGITIPCPWKSEAVSDGDVLLHALVDAILGACGLGDIGDHFPESKVRRGADSTLFLRYALDLLANRGGRVVNADCVVDIERPRLGETKPLIRDNLARLLGVTADRVNVKAKTAEGLGPVGGGLAIAAQAVVLAEVGR